MSKGLLSPGKVKVTLKCPLGNKGVCSVTVTWVPNPGTTLPVPRSAFVSPGQTQVLYDGAVLSAAAMRVDVSMPTAGSGVLTVEQPGTTDSWTETVSGQQAWFFDVDVP
jgi:hypothetical protein